ncbi:hypothetical protein HBI56_026390 [Parastagonospora nodorum]|uniref:Uncharacterized protein n=1 Tax=Phaeosphaeria nodorum (strain SN15 / ATCC MYA-4574 / FGSC 10173) TaxID=321614 RepID=A0A7U2F1C2_PHANO|nr:hypothetical protein HBH56_014050 [Parastagonospora nodorum]QRC94910.1 hypothetical protein JI435_406500 [Parastagonospora nodorum SN15]KAH3937458.1 hypothetical protein HBH54_020400 [Parastagonospora nodorum]KAH3953721.1 hypothetical protein HBH53_032800 [Parastagonospora nodorum]KAH3969228.1 hypothetical protein HBH51_124960 [Parastagonospora nodorum]
MNHNPVCNARARAHPCALRFSKHATNRMLWGDLAMHEGDNEAETTMQVKGCV